MFFFAWSIPSRRSDLQLRHNLLQCSRRRSMTFDPVRLFGRGILLTEEWKRSCWKLSLTLSTTHADRCVCFRYSGLDKRLPPSIVIEVLQVCQQSRWETVESFWKKQIWRWSIGSDKMSNGDLIGRIREQFVNEEYTHHSLHITWMGKGHIHSLTLKWIYQIDLWFSHGWERIRNWYYS